MSLAADAQLYLAVVPLHLSPVSACRVLTCHRPRRSRWKSLLYCILPNWPSASLGGCVWFYCGVRSSSLRGCWDPLATISPSVIQCRGPGRHNPVSYRATSSTATCAKEAKQLRWYAPLYIFGASFEFWPYFRSCSFKNWPDATQSWHTSFSDYPFALFACTPHTVVSLMPLSLRAVWLLSWK